jgi:hypothetical protein
VDTFAAEPEPKSMPPLVGRPSTSCAPLQLSPMPCKLPMRSGNYCLIVNRIEKNYREQKGLTGRQLTRTDPFQPAVSRIEGLHSFAHIDEAGSKRSSRSIASLRSMPYGGSRFNSSKVQRKINQEGELPRFGNSQNVEMSGVEGRPDE